MIYNELEAQVLGAIHERLVDLPLYLEWGLKTEHFLTPEYKEIFQKINLLLIFLFLLFLHYNYL